MIMKYKKAPLIENVEEMFIGPFGSSLKNECFVSREDAFCIVYEQKHAIQKTMNVETRYIDEKKFKELKRFNIKSGDIIVSCRGTIGETYVVPEDAPLGIMHPSIMKIRLKEGVYDKYYFNTLLKMRLKKHETEANGSGIKMAISAKELGKELFPVPPIKDQEIITHILSSIESLILKRKQQLAKLDELVKARFVELFGEPMENPHNYLVKRIDEVAGFVKGITYSPEEVCDKDGIVVLRSSNIKGSTFDLQDIVTISKKVSSEKLVKENDILMCNRNGSARLVGKVALIPKLDEDMTFGTFMTIVRSPIYKYLFVFFQTEAFRRQIQFQTAVAINQISLPLLASVTVPIPPKELQNQFAAFVEQVDKSKVAVQKALDEAQTLFDSLMQQYFG